MKALVFAAAIGVWILMVVGGLVSATGSGLGCGPEWPLCHGQLIPSLSEPTVFLEWFHRLVAAVVGVLVLAAGMAAWQRTPRLAGLAITLLIGQALLGAVTVWLELPVAVSTAHLAVGTALFAVLIAIAVRAYGGTPAGSSLSPAQPAGGLLWAAAVVTYAQMVLGAYVRHSGAGLACPDPIVCLPSGYAPVLVHFAHRLLALAVLGAVHVAGGRVLRVSRDRGMRAAALAAMGLVVIQIALGALSVATTLSPHVTTAHLGAALLLLGCLVYLAMRTTHAGQAMPAVPQRSAMYAGEARG